MVHLNAWRVEIWTTWCVSDLRWQMLAGWGEGTGSDGGRAHLGALYRLYLGYRGTSLIRKRNPLGPYRRPMPRVLEGSWGGGRFLMSEVPL